MYSSAAFSDPVNQPAMLYGTEHPPETNYGSLDARYHYAKGIYSSAKLREHAEWFLAHKDEITHDFVVATGKSGMSVAFAALAMQDFPLVTVRKGESSHGVTIEGTAPTMGRYILLDDLVDSGATLRRVDQELGDWAMRKSVARPKCAGAILYNHQGIYDAAFCARYIRRN